jgi:hypothetical protein
MAESYAGITVPEGEPGTVRDAARTFTGVAGGLHGASADLRSVPGLVSDWKGPASAAFGGTVITNGSAVDGGAGAMATCAQAASTYAEELEQAQRDARKAIADARDAQGRIDDANADIEAALGAQTQASNDIASAESRINSSIGVPDVGAVADRDAANTALANAQSAESAARRRLQQAQDDLADAKQRGHQAEQDAKRAARTAAGAFEGVAGHTPAAAMFGGSPHAIENTVLARVRAGDYSVLDQVAFNYLPEDTQRAIAAEIADESLKASYGDGSHSMSDMADVVDQFDHDDEFATGFYNELGGDGARELASSIIMFNGRGEGLDDPALVALMTPFATLLGTATRSRDLRSDFTDEFIGDGPMRDRIPGHLHMVTFVMAGAAANYGSNFLSRVGEEVLVESQDAEDAPPFVELSDYQDFMKFIADNPQAAGELLAGHHGQDDYLSNVGPLLRYGSRYTDDGEALGALIQAGTHDLRVTDLALANNAAHAVIQGVPTYMDGLGDGAKPALTTILDDHIEDFEYVAMDRAEPGLMAAPDGGISGLTYEQGQDYLQALVGDDATRTDATHIVGDRVGYDIYQSAALGDTGYANRAGALSEMSVLATAEANLDDAQTQDAMNNLAKTAAGKLVGLTPPGKVPGFDIISGQALDQIFSTDAVKHALEDQTAAQVEAFGGVKQLSIAAQVQLGQLPPEAMRTIHPDGTLNVNFVDGPNYDQDVIKVDTDGDGTPDRNLEWDLDHDGEISADEREITERELYDSGLGTAEAAGDGITSLYDVQYEGKHPPDIDDLELPDGLDNDNPNTFEKVWNWPFDAPGEGTISDGSGVVAHQDDLHWDPSEKVYNLDVEGHDQLHYQRIDGEWKLVEKIDGEWQPIN